MNLRRDIDRMYREIVDNDGSFGDPIETGSYNPFEFRSRLPSSEVECEGVGVAMLCYLMTAIANGTYEDALTCVTAKHARLVRREALFEEMPAIDRALEAFFESESAFMESLKVVYTNIVARRVGEATQQDDATDGASRRR